MGVRPSFALFFYNNGISVRTLAFIYSVKQLKLKIIDKYFFYDHQNYNKNIITKLYKKIKLNCTKSIVTTEKDLVKLPKTFLDEFKVYIIKIEICFEDENKINNIIYPLLTKPK